MSGESKPVYTYTKVGKFQHCRLAYKYCYIDGLLPKGKSIPLQTGDIIHQLMHFRYEGKITKEFLNGFYDFVTELYPENDPDVTLSVAESSLTLFTGYLDRWKEDDWEVVSSEVWVEKDMGDYILRGRMDGLVRTVDKRLWRHEYKTTSKMDSAYLSGLKGGLQGAIYDFLTEATFDEKLDGTVYDMLVKTKVPNYHRAYNRIDRKAIERMHETVEGVHHDIQSGYFYPSSKCFNFASECEYKILCEHDTPEVRASFFTKRVVEDDTKTNKEALA